MDPYPAKSQESWQYPNSHKSDFHVAKAPPPEALTRLARALSQSHQKDVTLDYAPERALDPPLAKERDREIPPPEPPARKRDYEHDLEWDWERAYLNH